MTLIIPSVQTVVDHWLATLGWGSVITFFGSLAWCLLKIRHKATQVISEIDQQWKDAREDIKEAKQKLDTATSNHLTHIEAATATTATLMERQNGILERIVEANAQNAVALARIEVLLQIR